MLSPLGWVLFRTLQRLQCNCANKNALLTCENKKLTATKKNPGQFMLRGFYSLLPQLAGSLIRAVSGDGGRPDQTHLLTRIGCSRLRGSRMIISWRLLGY